MVFSFFKKQPQKMPERPAARPRAPDLRPEVRSPKPLVVDVEPLSEPLPDLEFTTTNLLPEDLVAPTKEPIFPTTPTPKPVSERELAFAIDEFDRDFTDSSVMAIDVEHGSDPVQADIEQVVVMFANGQDSAARALLEMFIRAHPGIEGRRFWALLFDLLQVVGDRQAFDALSIEFTEACETSPPAWRQGSSRAVGQANASLNFVLKGVLTAESDQPVDQLAHLLSQSSAIRVDCGKLIGCDDVVAGRLAGLLGQARRQGRSIALENIDGLMTRLAERLVTGQAEHAPAWLLLLELLQRHSTQAVFEERAIDYAVTFELSPPSWEILPGTVLDAVPAAEPSLDAGCYFSGEIKACRFEELVKVLEENRQPVLDFSEVCRMDFFSAGQLANRLAPYKVAGREILIRSPNNLVVELMVLVGLNKQARIIVPKS